MRHARTLKLALTLAALLSLKGGVAQAQIQYLPQDFNQGVYDERNFLNDQYRLQQDLNSGNLGAAINDYQRMQQDNWRVNQDVNRIRNDIYGPQPIYQPY